ncbi:S8 family serine peptidase [bacterium]
MISLSRSLWIICMVWITALFGNNKTFMKMDAGLRHLLINKQLSIVKNHSLNKESNDNIYILAEGDNCQSAIIQEGGRIYTNLGNMVSARVPFNAILALAQNSGIKQLSLPHHYHRRNDLLTTDIRADQVYAGLSPLSQSYTGAGVIIGVIDTGIDITHPDFKKSDGTSRILAVWDQNISGNPPSGYEYGVEWTKADIDNNLCTHEDDMEQGHGTHVAGIAAGNGQAIGQYRGIAPDAELIVVADNQTTPGSFIDAVNYIYNKADALGKPCVINASLGSHQGGHDGTDLESRMLDQLISESPGRAFCASAGNEGDEFIHLSYPTSVDSFYTYVYPGPDGVIMLYIRLPNAVLNQTHFAIGWDEHNYDPFSEDGGPIQFGGRTPWFSVQETVDNIAFYERANAWDGAEVGRVSFEFDTQSEDITVLRIIIEDDVIWDDENEIVEDMDLWRFMVWQPDDRMDVWVADLGYSYPKEISHPYYRDPDNTSSVGVPAVAKNVIAVGASVNRESYIDQFGDTWINSDDPAGSLASFSSRGPTADGRLKPDIVAPGHGVISTLSNQAKNSGEIDETNIVQGGKHMLSSGTSMSCPAVTGCIALYLQKHPNATAQQIYQVIAGTARQDDDTGINLPNNNWGYGKIDVFAMLTNTTTVDNRETTPKDFSLNQNHPNPFNNTTTWQYYLSETTPVQIKIQNLQGQQVFTSHFSTQQPGRHHLYLDATLFSSGVYVLSIETPKWKASKKMILMK